MRTSASRNANKCEITLLKYWGILASICVFATIIVASAFPLDWVAVWPAAVSLIPSTIFLYYLSPVAFRELKRLIAVCWKLIRSRRHFEDALKGYTSSLDLQLDGIDGEIKQLCIIAAELDWKMKAIPKRPARKVLSPT
jgi:hypothetical protein